jgi:hypothetical protein
MINTYNIVYIKWYIKKLVKHLSYFNSLLNVTSR